MIGKTGGNPQSGNPQMRTQRGRKTTKANVLLLQWPWLAGCLAGASSVADEIYSRPHREWFVSAGDKRKLQEASRIDAEARALISNSSSTVSKEAAKDTKQKQKHKQQQQQDTTESDSSDAADSSSVGEEEESEEGKQPG